MQSGYDKFEYGKQRERTGGADLWPAAWDVVKELLDSTDTEIRTPQQFDKIFVDGLTQSVDNWSGDVEMELGNADYSEQRIVYVHEFLDRFPDISDSSKVSFKRAEADSLWELSRQDEAEAVFRATVEQYPNDGWGYIGWSDRYYLFKDSPKEYTKGEEILLRGLANPDLEDRRYVLERLVKLYEEADYPEEVQEAYLKELALLLEEENQAMEQEKARLERKIQQWQQEHRPS